MIGVGHRQFLFVMGETTRKLELYDDFKIPEAKLVVKNFRFCLVCFVVALNDKHNLSKNINFVLYLPRIIRWTNFLVICLKMMFKTDRFFSCAFLVDCYVFLSNPMGCLTKIRSYRMDRYATCLCSIHGKYLYNEGQLGNKSMI